MIFTGARSGWSIEESGTIFLQFLVETPCISMSVSFQLGPAPSEQNSKGKVIEGSLGWEEAAVCR